MVSLCLHADDGAVLKTIALAPESLVSELRAFVERSNSPEDPLVSELRCRDESLDESKTLKEVQLDGSDPVQVIFASLSLDFEVDVSSTRPPGQFFTSVKVAPANHDDLTATHEEMLELAEVDEAWTVGPLQELHRDNLLKVFAAPGCFHKNASYGNALETKPMESSRLKSLIGRAQSALCFEYTKRCGGTGAQNGLEVLAAGHQLSLCQEQDSLDYGD